MISEWISSDQSVTILDKDFIEERVQKFELNLSAVENKKWFKKMKGTGVSEMLFDTGGKALRVHCIRVGNDIILINGYVKKGKTDNSKVKEADILAGKYKKGELNVRAFPTAYREQ